MKAFHNLPSFRNVDTVVTLIVIYNVRKKTSHTLNEEEVMTSRTLNEEEVILK